MLSMTLTCCWEWLLLLIICEDEVSLLVFDIEAFDIDADVASTFEEEEPAANANKLALNPLASTMPPSWLELLMAATLFFDDKAACKCQKGCSAVCIKKKSDRK